MPNWAKVLQGMAHAVEAAAKQEKDRSSSRYAKICGFWNCQKPIRQDHTLCYTHYQHSITGRANTCPGCRRYKDTKFEWCIDCRRNGKTTVSNSPFNGKGIASVGAGARAPTRRYEPEHSPTWDAADADAKVFYVYILKLTGGEFYAGQTRELRERLSEHRDGRVKSTRELAPKLVWFTELSTRSEATELESELKKVIDRNPRIIRRMITDFHDLVRELNFG